MAFSGTAGVTRGRRGLSPGGSFERFVGRAGGKLLIALGVALFGIVLVRTAWLCDDAYITFRTLHNFVNGYGLTWNVGERVQTYTHPLWMLLLAGVRYFSGEFYYSALALSMAMSLAAVAIVAFGLAQTAAQAVLALAILVSSKAFVDYGTSGLENPLSYLLVALFLLAYLGARRQGTGDRAQGTGEQQQPTAGASSRRLLMLSLLAGLLVLNRMDLLLLVAPALILAFWRVRSLKAAVPVALGFAPFIGWEAFSVIYYGFPFPNTAYAKLSTGIPAFDLIRQSTYYFLHSLWLDPLTLAVIVAAIAAAAVQRRCEQIAMAAGIVLYLLYILRIGGDFMAGRLFSVPLLAAVGVLAALPPPTRKLGVLAGLLAAPAVIVLGLFGPRPNLTSGSSYGQGTGPLKDEHGVADERGVYYSSTGLRRGVSRPDTPDNPVLSLAIQVATSRTDVMEIDASMGMFGYYTGPRVYVMDPLALPDPLLARLPISRDAGWRIGHFRRFQPDGYARSLLSGDNEITDFRLREYYERIRLIVRGPVFSAKRWMAILGMNLGWYDDLIDADYFHHPPLRVFTPSQTANPDCTVTLNKVLPPAGAWILLDRPRGAGRVALALDSGEGCAILFPRGVLPPAELFVPAAAGPPVRVVEVPADVSKAGMTRFLIRPLHRQDRCRVGKVWVVALRATAR